MRQTAILLSVLTIFSWSNNLAAQVALHSGAATSAKQIEGGIQDGDYPKDSIKNCEEGTVTAHIVVQDNGAPSQCVAEGGSPRLQDATCKVVSRFKFAPATNDQGGAIAANVIKRIRWILPESCSMPSSTPRRPPDHISPTLSAGKASIRFLMGSDGAISNCTAVIEGERQHPVDDLCQHRFVGTDSLSSDTWMRRSWVDVHVLRAVNDASENPLDLIAPSDAMGFDYLEYDISTDGVANNCRTKSEYIGDISILSLYLNPCQFYDESGSVTYKDASGIPVIKRIQLLTYVHVERAQ